jgi:uncharacterized membrane protein YkoI
MRFLAALRHRLPALVIAGLAVVASAVAPLAVSRERESPGAEVMQARDSRLSLDQAIELVERRFRARVVRAGVDESSGQRLYVLRLLSEEGRVWTVRVDAQTGATH